MGPGWEVRKERRDVQREGERQREQGSERSREKRALRKSGAVEGPPLLCKRS